MHADCHSADVVEGDDNADELPDTRPRLPRPRAAGVRVSDDTLLDAARACVLADGVRRTTLAEIARTAEVSRMTLYRRFPDVGSILAALMTREFGALLRDAASAGALGKHARERLVNTAVAAVRGLVSDPLMRTVLDRDAALLLPYITERLGKTQRLAEEALRGMIADGHRDGSIRESDTAVQARAALLIVQSFVLSLRPATGDGTAVTEDSLLTELRHLLDGALRENPS